MWHEYTREGRTKHWTDFNIENKNAGLVEKPWWEMDNESKRRLRHMLQEEDNNIDLTIYGLGNVRTHHEYELYAGINFKLKKLHPEAIKGTNPSTNDETEWYKEVEKEYTYNLEIPKPDFDFKFIYIGIEDKNGDVLYRNDLQEYVPILNVNISSFTEPLKWVYWPVDKQGNWLNKKDTNL